MVGLVINHVKLGLAGAGGRNPVGVMGIINASPESFFGDSVKTTARSIGAAAGRMAAQGADIIDVGGMSTAPYLDTAVSEKVEMSRVTVAVGAVRRACDLPVSVDTSRARVAAAALDLGAEVINDVSGFKHDASMAGVLARYGGRSAVLCAHDRRRRTSRGNPVGEAVRLLAESVDAAVSAGTPRGRIVIDPAIGFFRGSGRGNMFTRITTDWFARDLAVIQNLGVIKKRLGLPVLVSVSNKSFVGRLLGAGGGGGNGKKTRDKEQRKNPRDRMTGSAAVEAMCVLNGADIIRTHNVGLTLGAVRAAEAAMRVRGDTARKNNYGRPVA